MILVSRNLGRLVRQQNHPTQHDVREGVSGVGGDGPAAGEVAGDGFPYGEDDVSSEAQTEDLLRRLAAFLAAVAGVATVAAGRNEPVAAARLTRRGERGKHAAGAGWGEVSRTAGEGGSGDPAGELGEAEAHSRRGGGSAFVL